MYETPLPSVITWLATAKPKVLNIAGPRQSGFPLIDVQARARKFLMDMMFMQPR